MKRLTIWLGMAIALLAADRLMAGPEPIETKDYKAAPQPIVEQPSCRWTGFYIGAHGGYSWGDLSFRELDETDPAYEFDPEDFFGGGQVGANLQLGPWFVIGVEGTFSGGDFSDGADIFTNGGGEHSRGHVDSDWIATVAGRVGVSFWHNRLLAYARGGAAFTEFDYDTEEVGGSERFHANEDRTAGLVGGGIEYAFTCHWSVKLEYNHLFFGSEDVTGIEDDGESRNERTFSADVGDRDLVQAGLNFKF